jgi:phosphoribosyl 1,2-cyclic phosphodiesterase
VRVFVLSSGSCGNAIVVEAEGVRILIDAGIGPKRAVNAMRALGGEIFPRGFDAIVITHHHGDHMAHLEQHARSSQAPLYLHSGIVAPQARKKFVVHSYERGEHFNIGALTVRTLAIPHDAPQIAISVSSSSRAFGIVTDLGHVPYSLLKMLGDCDAALVEANYCDDLLDAGPYPMHLKRRVSGDFGHLSNEQTAELAARLVGTRLGRLYLCHLSKANNSPARALAGVRASAPEIESSVILHGEPHLLDIGTCVPTRRRAEQLSLSF